MDPDKLFSSFTGVHETDHILENFMLSISYLKVKETLDGGRYNQTFHDNFIRDVWDGK